MRVLVTVPGSDRHRTLRRGTSVMGEPVSAPRRACRCPSTLPPARTPHKSLGYCLRPCGRRAGPSVCSVHSLARRKPAGADRRAHAAEERGSAQTTEGECGVAGGGVHREAWTPAGGEQQGVTRPLHSHSCVHYNIPICCDFKLELIINEKSVPSLRQMHSTCLHPRAPRWGSPERKGS